MEPAASRLQPLDWDRSLEAVQFSSFILFCQKWSEDAHRVGGTCPKFLS